MIEKIKNRKQQIVEYAIYFLVFLLPLQTRYFLKEESLGGAFWEYGSISLYLVDLLLIIIVVFSIVEILKKRLILSFGKVWLMLGIFELFVFISIFFAPTKILAIYGYFKVLLGFGMFFLISQTKLDIKKLYISFLSAIFFQSILGLWQFFSNYSPANKFFGLAEHNPESLGTFVVELESGERILRAYGGLDHPNIYGFLIFIGIFVFVRYLLTLKNYNYLNKKQQLFYFFILGFFFFSFLISFSRAAYLIFIFYLIFLLFWSLHDKRRRNLIAKIILVFFVVFLFTFSQNKYLFQQRFSPDSRLENISNNERLDQFQVAKEVIKTNFLFGVGINNYTNHLQLEDAEVREAWYYQPVHNVYLLVLAEIGILGFLTFIGVIIYLFFCTIRTGVFFDSFLIISILIVFLLDHWLWSLHFGILLLFFLLGLVQRRVSN